MKMNCVQYFAPVMEDISKAHATVIMVGKVKNVNYVKINVNHPIALDTGYVLKVIVYVNQDGKDSLVIFQQVNVKLLIVMAMANVLMVSVNVIYNTKEFIVKSLIVLIQRAPDTVYVLKVNVSVKLDGAVKIVVTLMIVSANISPTVLVMVYMILNQRNVLVTRAGPMKIVLYVSLSCIH